MEIEVIWGAEWINYLGYFPVRETLKIIAIFNKSKKMKRLSFLPGNRDYLIL
jgi:hypothetical protein